MPTPNVVWDDLESDEAISKLAYYGLGQVVLVADPSGDHMIDLSHLASDNYEVRPGFERYGATARFVDRKLKSITWPSRSCTNKEVSPGDSDWEHAKFVFKASLNAEITMKYHLAQTHMVVVNGTHVCVRKHLSPDHPIRRILKVHLFRTGMINFTGTKVLLPEDNFMERGFAFNREGYIETLRAGAEAYRVLTFPEFVKSKRLSEDVAASLPMVQDGTDVWGAFHQYFTSYVSLYYADDGEVCADRYGTGCELMEYWVGWQKRGQLSDVRECYRLPPLSKAALIDHLTLHTFMSTAWHELVGSLSEYLTLLTGLPPKIRPEKEVPFKGITDVQSYIQGNSILALTGFRMPQLLDKGGQDENGCPKRWKHLLLPDEHLESAKSLVDQLCKDLEEISDVIAQRNQERLALGQAFRAFDPQTFETSVSL